MLGHGEKTTVLERPEEWKAHFWFLQKYNQARQTRIPLGCEVSGFPGEVPQCMSRLPHRPLIDLRLPKSPLSTSSSSHAGSSVSTSQPHPEVYVSLIETHGSPGNFSPSFSELQRNFVKHQPTKLKSLLRLVKHWYLQVRESCQNGDRREC